MQDNPYAASSARSGTGSDGALPLSGLARAITVLLVLNLVATVAVDLCDAFFYAFAPHMLDVNDETEPMGIEWGVLLVQLGAGLVNMLSLVIAIAFWTRWHARAAHNAEVRGQPTGFTPGWHAGAWFVPFVNLYYPFVHLRRLYAASLPGNAELSGDELDQPEASPPSSMGLWWGVHIIGGILASLAFRLTMRYDSGIASTFLSWASTPFIIVDVLLYLGYVRAITELQDHRPDATGVPGA